MHRSGTSAVAGMLEDHGIDFGPVRTRNRFNKRGNRELPELNSLHEEILQRAGGCWWDPPSSPPVTADDVRRRDEILATIAGDPAGVKDPRMLVCPELWSDLDLNPILAQADPGEYPRYCTLEGRNEVPDTLDAQMIKDAKALFDWAPEGTRIKIHY